MSISTQITRITELRDRLRTKLTAMGLATSTSKLEDLTEAVEDITTQGAQTYTPGTTNQTVAAGQYLTGAQTISGDANLTAENIADGVSIFGVAGTHMGGTDTTDATMTSGGQMLFGVTAYSKGTKYTGTIATKSSSDLTASGATVTVPAGYYSAQATKNVATTTHPNPTVSVNSTTGVITASHTQTAGYVSAGTTTGTAQLPVYDGTVEGGA